MSKYPQVEAFFSARFGDEHGVVGADERKKIVEATGVKYATASRWVNGDTRPDAVYWVAIAGAAGVSPTEVKRAINTQFDAQSATEVQTLEQSVARIEARIDVLERAMNRKLDELADLGAEVVKHLNRLQPKPASRPSKRTAQPQS